MVTGGAGFIGSAVIRQLINVHDFEVINLDKLTYAANLDNLKSISNHSSYYFEKIDICDSKKVKDALRKYSPNVILNLAAESHVDRSIDTPAKFVETNIIGTYNLLEASLEHFQSINSQEQNKFRFHHVSTDEVFGSLNFSDSAFSLSSPYKPRSPYSASKAASDHLVMAWHHTFGLPIILSNSSNNYGPFQYPEKLIPLIITRALEGAPLPVYGRGENIRDWLYIDDHTDALIKVITHGQIGETYLIGGDSELSNIYVVETICKFLDEALPDSKYIPHKNLISFVDDRPGHDLRYALDITKTKQKLGWTPKYSFEVGLKKTIYWYINNKEWWMPLFKKFAHNQQLRSDTSKYKKVGY